MSVSPLLKIVGMIIPVLFMMSSCQKEISGDNNTPSCRLSKITYYNGSTFDDSVALVYTNNRVTRSNEAGNYYNLYNYKDNRISSIDYYEESAGYLDIFDSVTYDGTGNIKSVIWYTESTGTNVAYSGYELFYNAANVPERVVQKAIVTTGGPMVDVYVYSYTYDQGNAVRLIFEDLTGTIPKDTVNFTHDANANYYKKMGPDFVLLDNYFSSLTGQYFGLFAPFIYSKNNVATQDGLPVIYETDAKGNITKMNLAGSRIITYDHTCQ
jgi:hypothetical protein